MVKASQIDGMPKRPMSAYFLWMSEEGRAAAQKKLGDCGVAEVSKCCGEMWRSIDEKSKKKYEKKQAELKKKYDVEYPAWLENGGQALVDAAKKAKKEKNDKKKAKAAKAAKGAKGAAKGKKAPKKKQESEDEEEEDDEEDDE